MSHPASTRAGLGLVTSLGTVVLLAPRSLPQPDALDPARQAAEITDFGLRTMAALLAGYLALVFLGVLLAAVRVLPSSIRGRIDRWTSRQVSPGGCAVAWASPHWRSASCRSNPSRPTRPRGPRSS